MTTNRTRRAAEGTPTPRPSGVVPVSSSPMVTRDANGHLVGPGGRVLPEERNDYEMQIIRVEEMESAFKGEIKQSLRISVELLGTEQPFGDYAGKPFVASLFCSIPKKGKLYYTIEGKTKKTDIARLLESMGYDLRPTMRFQDLNPDALIGGFLKGGVFHNDKGYANIKVTRTVEDEEGNQINVGLKPVVNEEHLKENQALRNEIFLY